MTPAIRIQARSPRGHRRCGLRHLAKPVLHPPGTFSPDDFRTLCDDPRLLVEIVGDLAMDVLTGPEIAATMGGLTATGGHFAGWQVPAGWDVSATAADAPESMAPADGQISEIPAQLAPAEASAADAGASEPEPAASETSDVQTDAAPPEKPPARGRKAKEA